MRILVTGSEGFLGRNLCAELENIRCGRRRGLDGLLPLEIFRYDLGSTKEELRAYCAEADLAVHLAGVNRPKDQSEFMEGNLGLTEELLRLLKESGRACPVLLSSSTQAELDNPYGRSKLAAERSVRAYADETGADAFIFRFPNLFGKWCRPNYNSAVATFCNNIANGLPIRVDDESKLLRLAYVDDVVDCIIDCITGRRAPERGVMSPEPVYERSLGFIAGLIRSFRENRAELTVPDVSDPFTKKLYSAYLSYVPASEAEVYCDTKSDERGSFTEILRTEGMGQISVNICRPGFEKGNHWHHTKTERFIVVSGEGVIRQRRIGSDEVEEIPVCAKHMCSVDMLPGYTHSIENTGEEDLIFIIWANERFDPQRPDTFYEKVLKEEQP